MSMFRSLFRRKSIEKILRDHLFEAELERADCKIAAERFHAEAQKEEVKVKMADARIKRLKAEIDEIARAQIRPDAPPHLDAIKVAEAAVVEASAPSRRLRAAK